MMMKNFFPSALIKPFVACSPTEMVSTMGFMAVRVVRITAGASPGFMTSIRRFAVLPVALR